MHKLEKITFTTGVKQENPLLPLLYRGLRPFRLLDCRVGPDGCMHFLVNLVNVIRFNSLLNIVTEMSLMLFWFILHQSLQNRWARIWENKINVCWLVKQKGKHGMTIWFLPSYMQQHGHHRYTCDGPQHRAACCLWKNQQTSYHCVEYPNHHPKLPVINYNISTKMIKTSIYR